MGHEQRRAAPKREYRSAQRGGYSNEQRRAAPKGQGILNTIPIVTGLALDDTIAWRACGPVSVQTLLADAQAVAAALPAGDWVLNLCEDRYHFAVVFAACLLSRKTSLQPASHSVETLNRLAQDYAGAFCVTDGESGALDLARVQYSSLVGQPCAPVAEIARVDADRVVAILFTSGSSGLPQPHGKTWAKLVRNGRAEAQALGLHTRAMVLVGTVPVQHSYGFESTFLLAMHGGCAFWCGKPFYPQDVADALQAVPRPRMLVTTPYHLALLLATDVALPALDLCLSATAPLSTELAARVEHRLGAEVHEIYGSTESSQLASRRTTDGAPWQLLPGVLLEQDTGTACAITYASGGHVQQRVALSDNIALLPDGRFTLHGRHADMVNIAGKRTSLAYLNHQLCAIDGVHDGAFFQPHDDAAESVGRLTAFVVAPDLDSRALIASLRRRIDSVFLPRPLIRMDALPRNSTGKLPRSVLQALVIDKAARGER